MQNHTKSCLYGGVRDDSNSVTRKVLVPYYKVGMTNIFTIGLTTYQSLYPNNYCCNDYKDTIQRYWDDFTEVRKLDAEKSF